MDVTGLSDPELIALLKIMRLGVRAVKHGPLPPMYQITFVSDRGCVLSASFTCPVLRECFASLTSFGDGELARFGQHPTRQPEINYP